MSSRDPVPGRRSSRPIFFAVSTKRAAVMPTIGVPRTISASPAMLPNFWPGNDRVRPAKAGAPNSRNRSNFSTRNPKAITAMEVRTQARNVRSFAEWSLKFLIILSANMNPRNGTINIKRIAAQWDKVSSDLLSATATRTVSTGALYGQAAASLRASPEDALLGKQATGMTPLQFVTRERMVQAQQLIRETS